MRTGSSSAGLKSDAMHTFLIATLASRIAATLDQARPVTAEAEDYILERLERLLEKTDRSRD